MWHILICKTKRFLMWHVNPYSAGVHICFCIRASISAWWKQIQTSWKEKVVFFPYLCDIIAFEIRTVNVKEKIWTCEAEIWPKSEKWRKEKAEISNEVKREGVIHDRGKEDILKFCSIFSSYSYSCVSKVNHLLQDQNQIVFPLTKHNYRLSL